MKETLDKLWHDYLLDECATIQTEEERRLTKRVAELHEKVNVLMHEHQQDTVEKYIDALYDLQALFEKKAFFKGCEFAVSFLLETRGGF